MRMGDLIERMMQDTITAITHNDRKTVKKISKMDDAVDKLHETIKLYVVKITQNSLEDQQSRRAMEILSLSINLEHIGDIIDKNLMELASLETSSLHLDIIRDLKRIHSHICSAAYPTLEAAGELNSSRLQVLSRQEN